MILVSVSHGSARAAAFAESGSIGGSVRYFVHRTSDRMAWHGRTKRLRCEASCVVGYTYSTDDGLACFLFLGGCDGLG